MRVVRVSTLCETFFLLSCIIISLSQAGRPGSCVGGWVGWGRGSLREAKREVWDSPACSSRSWRCRVFSCLLPVVSAAINRRFSRLIFVSYPFLCRINGRELVLRCGLS